MTKVVINTCFGGFSLSKAAYEHMGVEWDDYGFLSHTDMTEKEIRTDPKVIAAVEFLGAEANGSHAELAVIELPDGVDWNLENYDGNEWVAEVHRTWR